MFIDVFYKFDMLVLFLYIVLTCICDVMQSTKKIRALSTDFLFLINILITFILKVCYTLIASLIRKEVMTCSRYINP